jgi:HEAT repeat protein
MVIARKRFLRRQAAAIALLELELKEARETLQAAVQGPNSGARSAVRSVLERHGDAKVL